MLIAGQLFHERYLILREVAEGGQATVYMAQDKGAFDRLVAVKEFKITSVPLADLPVAMKQFEQTANLLAHLNHPNIAQIYEYVSLGNVPYLVTEFVMGGTLEQLLRSTPNGLPEEQVKQWAVQLCDVLTYLHHQSPPIIFRDLKPDNIMLAPNGQLKLIDFGIARTFKMGRASDTELLGTPGYSPPEQYGRAQTGPYSDVYALGATLLRLVTGYDPGTSPFQLPRADKIRPGITRPFADALATSTGIDATTRYASADAFRQALQPNQKKGKPKVALVAGLVSVIVLIALIGVAAVAMGLIPGILPAAPPTVPTVTEEVVATVEATATPESTPAPTSTSKPTDTPTPSPSDTPTPPPDMTATAGAERTAVARDIWSTATAVAAQTATAQPAKTGNTPTQAPNKPATPTPIATTAPANTGSAGSAGAAKAMFSFEKAFSWRRGDEPYGELAYSTEQAHDGAGSAKLTYNIPSVQNDYVVFHPMTKLSGQPTGLSLWVYGDGSGHFLNAWIKDTAGQVRQFSFGRVAFMGWRQMVAWFDTARPWPQSHISGPDSATLGFPVEFYGLVLDRQGGGNSGTIFIDEINPVTSPIPAQAAATSAPTTVAEPADSNAATATATQAPAPSGPAIVCNQNMAHVSNLCLGQNPVGAGGSTYAIWRIETSFKEGCFDKGDGAGCIGPITAQMRVDIVNIGGPRTITLSWVDGNDKHYTDSLTIQVQ